MTLSNALASRAMIISLNISQWSGRKLDRDVTDEVNKSHNAAEDASRVNKALLPREALAEIQRIVGATRTGFAARTLPWVDDGSRIINAAAYLDFTQWLNERIAEMDKAVDDFVAAYPGYLAAAGNRLGSMFDAADYPTVDDLQRRFSIRSRVMPVPSGDDFRVDMSKEQAELIRRDIEASIEQATRDANEEIARRVVDVVSRMVERLSAYRPSTGKGDKAEGVFRDSLISNVSDIVDAMAGLNITGSPGIDALAARLARLTENSADDLRKSEAARQATVDEAKAILDDMGQFFA